MGVEVERRFLVDPSLIQFEDLGVILRQGYLCLDPVVRVRVSSDNTAWLTVKGKGTVSRPEFEYRIPTAEANEMLAMTRYRVSKLRRIVRVADHLWDVDEFHDKHSGLWLGEVNLQAVDEAFVKPAWAIREVTDDPRYANARLAVDGIPLESPST